MCWMPGPAQPPDCSRFAPKHIRRPSPPLLALDSPPAASPGPHLTRCSHVTDVGKLRPREEVVLAHTLSMYHYPSPFIQACAHAVCPQARYLPSLG